MRVHDRARWLVLSILLVALLLLPFPAAQAQEPDLRTISVVSTNDIHGALVGSVQSFSHGDMVGGLDWVAGYLNLVREENPGGVLYLDAGDMMQGTLISNYWQGASTIEAVNEMGLKAMAIGNHEFDWGQSVLEARAEQAEFPFLAANIFYKEPHGSAQQPQARPKWLKPYIIRQVKGIKVGVIGVANPETPTLTNPINISDLEFTDPVEAVNDVLPEVEAEGATVIVVLAHIGGYYDTDSHAVLGEVRDLAYGLDPERVDAIVSGHTHSSLYNVINGIPVIQAYSGGTAFGRVDLRVDAATGEVVSRRMAVTTTFQTWYGDPESYKGFDGIWRPVVPDAAVAAIVQPYAAEIEALKSEVIGSTTDPITCNYRHESAMGDWVADIMREADGTDFAFTNSGGLRADIDAGDITYGEVFDVMPFDNTQVICELTGAQVREALEVGVSGEHGLVQVSGLQFFFDYDLPAGSRIVGDVIDLNTGEPLIADHVYTVATNDFMANGGDGYEVMAENPQTNTYVLVRDMMVDWVKAHPGFTAPDPAVEQRITDQGTAPA